MQGQGGCEQAVIVNRPLLSGNRAVMGLDDVLQGLDAGAAARLFSIRTGAVNIGNPGLSIAGFEVFADFLVAERVAHTDIHKI